MAGGDNTNFSAQPSLWPMPSPVGLPRPSDPARWPTGPQTTTPSDRITALDGPVVTYAEETDPRPDLVKTQPAKRDEVEGLKFSLLTEGYYYPPDASAYPSPYYLELYEDYKSNSTDPVDAVSIRYVSRIRKQDPTALVRTRAFDNSVYQENEGFAEAMFTLSGRSGDTPLDLVRFTKLRNFLQLYAKKMKENKNALVRGKDVQLVLHFPFEAESYLCDVMSFDYEREAASSPNSFVFTLGIITNSRVERKWRLPASADALQKMIAQDDVRHKDARHPCLVASEGERRELERDNPELQVIVGEPLLRAEESTEPACSDVVYSYQAIMGFAAHADRFPYVTYQDRFSSLFFTMIYSSDMAASAMTYSGSRFGRCTPPPRTLRAYEVWEIGLPLFFNLARPSMISAPVAGIPVPTDAFVCDAGHTNAFDIADTVYGDRTRAAEIINYNRMLDAYTFDNGNPLEVGDTVFIPRPTGAITRDGDTFGTDLRLENGDLVPVGTTDIATVSGYACYVQNLGHRMQTVRGENAVYPQYGLRQFIGQSDSSDIPADIRANVRGQILADHRTNRIISLNLRELGDKVFVDTIVEPVGVEPSRVTFTYNLVA